MLLRAGQVCEYVKHQHLATMASKIAQNKTDLDMLTKIQIHMVHGLLQIPMANLLLSSQRLK